MDHLRSLPEVSDRWRMCLKIMAELFGSDKEGMGELLYLQVSSLNPHEKFTNIVYWFLNSILFSNQHCTYC